MQKLAIIVLLVLLSFSTVLTAAWPDSGTTISQNLPAGYEPSGVVWHPKFNSLFLISDGGVISKMNPDGTGVTNWNIGGDLEGITIADPTSNYVYVVIEYPYEILRFNASSGTVSARVSLTGVVPATVATNQGIEGIAFVPNGYHPYQNSSNGGLFYFGVQENGPIHVVDVNFTAGTARLVDSFTPVAGRGDISDLYFSTETKTLYILYDSSNYLRQITTNRVFIREDGVLGTEQEGVALLPGCPSTTTSIIIAEDTPAKLVKYDGFPITCTVTPPVDNDKDKDGYNSTVDCNDNDATVNPGRVEVLYNGKDDDCNAATPDTIDADADGYNSNVDCNDNDANINPGKTEVLFNNKDDDCNAATLDTGDATTIHQNLPAGYGPSGVIWHPYYNALFLVNDGGTVSKMNIDGTSVTNWALAGDLESVTITDPASKYIYITIEYPFEVIKFDPTTGSVVKRVSLTGIVPATTDSGQGIQGTAFVPNGYHSYQNSANGGLFYFGIQENGRIYAVDVNFDAGTATLIGSFTPVAGRVDISDLYYSTETKNLYVLYNAANILSKIKIDNRSEDYVFPEGDYDGMTILPGCPSTKTTLVIAEDSPAKVTKYGNYPIVCAAPVFVDADNDGYNSNVDCNDSNANINPGKTEVLYNGIDDDCNAATKDTVDADADGYNSNVDCNDNDPNINPGKTEILYNGKDDDCNAATKDTLDADNDGYNSNVDCNDSNANINPGKTEVLYNGIDDDCNAATKDVVIFPWPANATGTQIQQNLPAGYGPSGVVWHPYYKALFLVSDSGKISRMNVNGTNVTNWTLPGDLESITVADPASKYIYTAIEYPFRLIRFDPETKATKNISLTGVIPAITDTSKGIQGIAYVPNGYHPYANSSNGGLFYLGMQENGAINVVDANFTAGTARFVGSFTPAAGRADISDLYFSTETNTLYVLYNTGNILRQIRKNNITDYSVPGTKIDGITVLPACPNTKAVILVTEDSSPSKVMKYGNYPITCGR